MTPTACTGSLPDQRITQETLRIQMKVYEALRAWAVGAKIIIRNTGIFVTKTNGRTLKIDVFMVFKFQHKNFGVHFSPILGWGFSQLFCFSFPFWHCVTLLFLPPTTSEVNPSPGHPVIFSNNDWYVQSPPKRIVLRFHCHHSQFW